MAPFPEQDIRSRMASRQTLAPRQRTTVLELFQHYVRILSGLPGERSEFSQTEMGYEWLCQLELGANAAGDSLQLSFHLVDLDVLPAPAAVLMLVESGGAGAESVRQSFSLEDLEQTREQFNRYLADAGATVAAFQQVGLFFEELTVIRGNLPQEISWS
jgi:hypothetical protein